MFLPKEAFEDIKKIFIPSTPLNLIDKDGELRNMDSLYALEDFIKENIYDKKYPGVLPSIDPNMSYDFSEEEEGEEEDKLIEKNNQNKLNEENQNQNQNEKNKIEKKYKIIPGENDIFEFTENYSTDDEDQYNAIKLLNENKNEGNEEGWVLSINKDKMKIYYKIVKLRDEQGKDVDSLFFYAEANIDYDVKKTYEYINDFNHRCEYDNSYKLGKIINEQNDEKNNLKIVDYYLYLKMPFMFTDRDFVIRKKIWDNFNNKKDCFLINIKSIENPDYPAKDKPVRAYFINRSGYLCPDGDGQCKLYLATCFDVKLNVGVSMMKNKGNEGQVEWINKLIETIKKHEG